MTQTSSIIDLSRVASNSHKSAHYLAGEKLQLKQSRRNKQLAGENLLKLFWYYQH